MLSAYAPLLVLAALSALTLLGVFRLQRLLQPSRPSPEKLETYECGEKPIGDARKPIDLKYYLYVLVFLVLDVEVVLLVPWAVRLRALGPVAFGEVVVFVAILLAGWAYAWRTGGLRWPR